MEIMYSTPRTSLRNKLKSFLEKINHYSQPKNFQSLIVNPLIFEGFISLHWNRLPGIGLLKNIGILRRISHLEDLIDIKVQERTMELEDSKKQLEAFGYYVSHDLKAPLRIIKGYCSILKSSPDTLRDEGPEVLQVISDSANRMDNLIDNLLLFSQTSCAQLIKQKTDMESMVKAVIFELQLNSSLKPNIILHHLPEANCDAGLIKQVWLNLVSNAIKYSGKRDEAVIEIGAETWHGSSLYYIKDNGAGFDMKFANRLFRAFHRLHSESEYEGIGIGLALVHSIVSRHGGKIWAEAEVNKGATFYFTL